MKKLFVGIAALIAMAFSATAKADVYVTPQVGYQFQTKNVVNKQEHFNGVAQKNHATYGVQVGADVDAKTQVGLEYLATNSNVNSFQVGVIGNRELVGPVYGTAGLGYTKVDGIRKDIESPYINFGVGAKHQLTNMIAVKAEARVQYVTNENQWTPVALVGFEFNTDQITKAYSR